MKGIIVVLIVLVILLGSALIITNMGSGVTGNIVKEPYCYNKQVTYEESEPYTDKECEEKEFAYSVDFENAIINMNEQRGEEYFVTVKFDITNLENEKGIFYYQTIFELNNFNFGCYHGSNQWTATNIPYNNNLLDTSYSGLSREILAKSTENVYCSFKKATQNDNIYTNKDFIRGNVIPPKKQICNDVIKYRTITKTRTERVCE